MSIFQYIGAFKKARIIQLLFVKLANFQNYFLYTK